MLLEPGLIAYAAMASIAAAREKHWPGRKRPAALSPSVAKAIGVLLLLVSIILAFYHFGPAQGAVAWTGQLCVAGVALVLLMSWRFHFALKLAALSLSIALVQVLMHVANG